MVPKHPFGKRRAPHTHKQRLMGSLCRLWAVGDGTGGEPRGGGPWQVGVPAPGCPQAPLQASLPGVLAQDLLFPRKQGRFVRLSPGNTTSSFFPVA